MIGGMGPAATLDLFRKIIDSTPAARDQEHLHVLIDNFPQIPDRTAYLLGQGENPLAALLQSAQRLQRSGASALCMPCNTAHYFVEALRGELAAPFISIVESTLEEIVRRHPVARRIGLLATRGTLLGRVYHDRFEEAGLEILPLPELLQERLMAVIYGVKGGRATEQQEPFQCCLDEVAHMGAEVVIAGCTEIPLLLPLARTELPVVDPTLALARSVVDFALRRDEAPRLTSCGAVP